MGSASSLILYTCRQQDVYRGIPYIPATEALVLPVISKTASYLNLNPSQTGAATPHIGLSFYQLRCYNM